MTIARAIFLTLLGVLIALPSLAGDKTDVVTLKNGDRLTGDIKELQKGKLKFNTNATGNIYIEWDDIEKLTSTQDLQIELENGTRYFGTITVSDESDLLQVAWGDTLIGLYKPQVVMITPIEETFWSRIDGSLSVGFSYTKASDVAQLSIAFNATHRTRKARNQLTLNAITTAQEGEDTAARSDLSYSHLRLLPKRWTAGAGVGLESNDELGLALRASLTGGGGRSLIHTNHAILLALIGLSLNREIPIEGETTTNLEGVLGLSTDVFQYDDPEMDLVSAFTVFPNLTTWGRVRFDFTLDLRRELISDFFINVNFYDSFDSDPPSDANKNDFGIVFSLGWSF